MIAKFSPSLLDAFQQYLDSEALYEQFYGRSEEPSLTYQEYEEKQFNELIDKINKVPSESEAADKGSCLNEIVDCIVMDVKSTRDDIQVRSIKTDADAVGTPCTYPCVAARKGEHEFYFETKFCQQVADYFKDSLCQLYVEAPIETKYGTILLYGYPDYVRGDMVYDLKTTSKYEFGKYSKYWQQHAYPYALTKSGKCKDIKAFEFTAFQLKGGTARMPIIYGDMYQELYTFDYRRSESLLKGISEQFYDFINNNKERITNKKVFALE